MTAIKFWGVRGSIPTPGPTTLHYGGNTSCIEIRHDNKLFILDGGSGLRSLGLDLMKTKGPITAHIFISHMHWDHIQGIPFFTPAFIPGNSFTFYGAEEPDKNLATILADQMDPTYFPVELKDMGAKLNFRGLYEGKYQIEGIQVETLYVNHPGNALGFKFYFNGKTLIYISDNEPYSNFMTTQTGKSKNAMIGEDGSIKLKNFIKSCDLLIHDAQYTEDEYVKRITWGHSPSNYTVKIALETGVKHLVLFHHDPMHDDDKIDEILEKARNFAKGKGLEISAARESMILKL